jgi:hypothetical protein
MLSSYQAWRLCCALAVFLAALTFTPLVIPIGQAEPFVWGLPRTLWAGLLISLGFFVLTLWGTFLMVQQSDEEDV